VTQDRDVDLFTILLLGAVQAAFLLALILGKRGKVLSDWVLAAWVAVLGTHHLISFLVGRGAVGPSSWLNVNAGVPLLQGPFLFVYVQALTSGRRRLGAATLWHLLPFGLFAAYLVWGLQAAGPDSGPLSVFRVSLLSTIAILGSAPAYAAASWVLLRRHRLHTLERHSETRGRDLTWLRWIALTPSTPRTRS